MKIIILFALAGLSLAVERSCCVTSGCKPTNVQCLEFVVNHAPDFTVNLASFMCCYQGKITRYADNYNSFIKEILLTLKFSCCAVDEILDINEDQTLEEALAAAGKTLEDVARELFEFLDTLHLSEGATQILCALADHALTSTCRAKAPKKKISSSADNSRAFISKKDQISSEIKDLLQILRNAGCFGDDALGTGDTVGN
ncbi:ranaspumin-like isoform X2 [Engystomops pustulosus]|uniref:ranaspumin-like isoform X2 n=1 Tax=Engystomops pustulosus TaxID=76066 RepID=UPI003AFAD895